MSLRARLLIVTVALVGAGLLVANVAIYHGLRDFLLQRVDQQLVDAVRFAPGDGGGPGPGNLPLSTYVGLCDDHGSTVAGRFLGGDGYSPPVLPSDLPNSSTPGETTIFTAPSTDGSTTYRVLARANERAPGTLIIAIPVGDTFATLHRLLGVQILVSLVVLATVAALAWWLVRLGLQPLEGIGATAGAIAAGDLSRRVEPADERTEVGRLGLALNAMLAQIEAAFDQRRRSEERLRTFVADASHELRTPLTSIRGYAELFRRGADTRPEDLEKSMTRIEAEAARMGVLVDDLLLLARLDQGRPLEREPVDLVRLAGEAVDAARAVEPDRPLELEAEAAVEVPGDAGRLRQVLDNLLDNAREHTEPGTPIRVGVVGEQERAVLTVHDAGEGLDPETAAHAFERFYRGDPARSRSTGGAGLGLSIVAAIVRAHGGEVRVLPADPAAPGTTFEMRLPSAAAEPDVTSELPAPPADPPPGG
ncbi:MAG TPA: HAMP domain-containing sensor histidine kinase [Actinomycetota bacterium]|nr:HAMP domain-containing sensor histidine kinase [Actinomycetota bacterium]